MFPGAAVLIPRVSQSTSRHHLSCSVGIVRATTDGDQPWPTVDRVASPARPTRDCPQGSDTTMKPVWRKSARSASNGNCVEAAQLSTHGPIGVRDSKLDTTGDFPRLAVSPADWAGFLTAIRRADLA